MATITLPPVGHYTLDPARTTIGLSMKAMWGLVPVRATFALRRGTVTVSSATTAAVDVVAETASFASGIAKRDAHVKSADFLDVSAYPDLTFTGEELVGQGGTLRLRGVLTDRAATPAELEITELKQVLEGRDVGPVAGKLAAYRAQFGAVVGIVGARYLSPQTRARLTERGISYVDVTGNLRLQVDAPALFLADRGADADPWRGPGRPRGTLKGAPAAAIVRAILDLSSEWTMSDLIAISGVSTGAAYRVVDFLETEGLVERPSRGVIVVLDWVRVLRRWGEDYGFVRNTTVSRWIAPRGLDDLIARAADSPASLQYCFTGTVAAAEWAEYAPTRAAMVYTHDASATAETWGLRPAEAGANVLLGEPELRVPFVRTAKRADELTLAAPAQVAVDLMSGPGRNPAEAEELLDWMQAHEKSWRGHR